MGRHGALTCLALAGILCLAALNVWLWPTDNRITQAQFDQIETGMDKKEVETLLGRRADFPLIHGHVGRSPVDHCEVWQADENGLLVTVLFDKDSRVVGKEKWRRSRCTEVPSLLGRIRRWLPF